MQALETIQHRLAAVHERIRAAERLYGRAPGAVQLLAVSKTFPVADIEQALAAGQTAFGESYLQEALPKIAALAGRGVAWHYIGQLQSNKTRAIAGHFDWVHAVARLDIARRLSDQRPDDLAPLNVCLQVNISAEDSKGGVMLAELPALARQVAALPRLRLRGLMAIPAPEQDFTAQRAPFRRLREALERLQADGLALDTLSMGMSDDLEAAIAEGATLVRIGSAIFGDRPKQKEPTP